MLLHLLGAIVWIGGMFFAYMALRPAAATLLDPPPRLSLWRETLRRFFFWVWIAIVAIFGSGGYMLSSAYGTGSPPPYVLGMTGIATVMTVIFIYVYFVPFRRLSEAVAAKDWKTGGAALGRIRTLVGTNLILGVATVALAVVRGLLA
jgi:uncharacterized membrane protein